MAYEKTFRGNGFLDFAGRRLPAEYEITAVKTASRMTTEGWLSGMEMGDRIAVTGRMLDLILSDGQRVAVVVLGGEIDGPCRIAVNAPMPGMS
jgi:hypothetical protein